MPLQLTKVEVRRGGLPSGGTSQEHSVDTDKHYGNTEQGGVLKEKANIIALNAL